MKPEKLGGKEKLKIFRVLTLHQQTWKILYQIHNLMKNTPPQTKSRARFIHTEKSHEDSIFKDLQHRVPIQTVPIPIVPNVPILENEEIQVLLKQKGRKITR